MNSSRGTGRSILALVLFLVIASAVAGLGGLTTIGNVDGWYADADKAPWTPPNVVFGPVWSVLYALMSVAAWLIWRRPGSPQRRRALGIYVAQLVLNAIWTPVFFGLYPVVGVAALWLGLAIIVVLDVLVVLTVLRFWTVSRPAAALLIPYGAWLLYATTLNAAAAVLNL